MYNSKVLDCVLTTPAGITWKSAGFPAPTAGHRDVFGGRAVRQKGIGVSHF